MTIKTPYETTLGSKMKLSKVINELTISFANDDVLELIPHVYIVGATQKLPHNFNHPIVMEHPAKKEQVAVIDVSQYGRMKDESFVADNDTVYNIVRSTLLVNSWLSYTGLEANRVELDPSRGSMLNMSDLPLKVFTNIITDAIIKRLNVPYEYVNRIRIITALYYMSFFNDIDLSNEDAIRKVARRVSVYAGTETGYIVKMLTDMQADESWDFKNLTGYVSTLAANVDNDRIRNMNAGSVVTLLGGMWYGNNAQEQLSIALENPPTWMAMLYAALKSTGSKMQLSKYTHMLDKKGEHIDSYVRSMDRYLQSQGVQIKQGLISTI